MSGLIFKRFLQLFGEGGGAGGDGGGAAGGGGETGAAAQAPGTVPKAQTTNNTGKPGKAEDLSRVVYGRQADAEQADAGQAEKPNTSTPDQTEDQAKDQAKKPTFDELMQDPEYKAEFQRRFDKQFNRRFAENKAQAEQQAKLAPALNLLAAKYGVEAGNLDALLEAINGDNDLIERQAYDHGMEPDAYREYNRMMAENQQLKAAEQERQRQTQVNAQYQKWVQQAEQAKTIFPNLNLQQEVKNPVFAQMLGAGVDVATAYKAVHIDELATQLVQRSAQEAKASAAKAIQANRGRPRENGATAPKAATVKSDMTKLNAKDMDEIIRRAARGERIRW